MLDAIDISKIKYIWLNFNYVADKCNENSQDIPQVCAILLVDICTGYLVGSIISW